MNEEEQKPATRQIIKPSQRVMCGCGRQPIAIYGRTVCGRCKAESKYVTHRKEGSPKCPECKRRYVYKKGETLCSTCRPPEPKKQRRQSRIIGEAPKMIDRAIAPQKLSEMSADEIIKNWSKVQI